MAGVVGFEPTFQAPKTRVLTVGRYPNVITTLVFIRNPTKCISLARQMLHKLHQEQELLKFVRLQ